MKKSQLYAMYDNFGDVITEISFEEFHNVLFADNTDDTDLRHYQCNNETEVVSIVNIDGLEYMKYSSLHKTGWQGEYDSDEFYCKKETVSKARMKEITDLFIETPSCDYKTHDSLWDRSY